MRGRHVLILEEAETEMGRRRRGSDQGRSSRNKFTGQPYIGLSASYIDHTSNTIVVAFSYTSAYKNRGLERRSSLISGVVTDRGEEPYLKGYRVFGHHVEE